MDVQLGFVSAQNCSMCTFTLDNRDVEQAVLSGLVSCLARQIATVVVQSIARLAIQLVERQEELI